MASVVNRDRPTFLSEAIVAVLDDRPDEPICIRTAEQGGLNGSVYVRASYLVDMLTPEALARARARIAQERLLADIGRAS